LEIQSDIDSISRTTFGENLMVSGNDFIYTGKSPSSISGVEIGGTEQRDADGNGLSYILFDNNKIRQNSKKLPSDIVQNTRYSTIIPKDESKTDTKYYSEQYYSNNINTYISYNVWDEDVSEKLKGDVQGKYKNFKIDSLSTIDLSGTTYPEGKFLNRTNFKSDGDCNYPELLIQSPFYDSQSRRAKAILLLSTLPFRTFKEAVLNAAFPTGYKNAKIIDIPQYYIYFIGGLLWKNREGDIDWSAASTPDCGYSDFSSPNNCYLTKVGYLALENSNDNLPLEPELLNIPLSTKNSFIDIFTKWADGSEFVSFEFDMKTYKSTIDTISADDVTKSRIALKRVLSQTTSMIVLAPGIFDTGNPLPTKLKVSKSDITDYVESFLVTYENIENGRKETAQDNSESEIGSNPTTNKIKLQIYNYFKNVNDKWVSDTEKCFNVCSGTNSKQSLYEYFKFIDRGWNPIGDRATINLSSFLTLGSNLQTSVYFFMSKLLRDSNFLFQILPTFINYKDAEDVSKIFKPTTTLKNNSDSGPMYCGIYVGAASKALDIGEKTTYAFANDGFSLDNATSDMVKQGPNSLVAFRVGFGAENQTIFKNVSLNQQEHKETGEYFKALSELVDKRGGTQKVYQGTDLLKLFKTRSYTCKVDALGCMSIQPLMYFNLENVPFFNGAYLITSVNHSISPNHMTTNFTGVRQSKFISEPNEEILADLNLDLNETNEIPKIEFTNLKPTNKLYKIGVLNPQDGFDFEKWDVDAFKQMGVNFNDVLGISTLTDVQIKIELDKVKDAMNKKGINTNSQVCMFLANVMARSNYLFSNETTWGKEKNSIKKAVFNDPDTIYYEKTIYYGTNPTSSGPYKDILNGGLNEPPGILSSTPTFTAGSISDVAFVSVGGSGSNFEEAINFKNDTLKPTEKKYPYYNIFPGDGWRFKPRGYLYITGRREYFAYGSDYLNDPDKITSNFLELFNAAIYVWMNKKPSDEKVLENFKNSYEAAGGNGTNKKREGTSSDFELTSKISCQGGVGLEDAFNAFESVLLAFDLKDDFNP
jgi:hypothetical protein